MENHINIRRYYKISDEVVARKVENQLVIVPLTSGVGSLDSQLFSLNHTGEAIWQKLDGTRTVWEIIEELATEFNVSLGHVEADTKSLMGKLMEKGLICETPGKTQ